MKFIDDLRRSTSYFEAGDYDVIVVGAGHAGCEAAHAVAKLGCTCLMLTMNLDSLANLPCNPSIGGTAKGQLVREIDAMGGLMGLAADKATLQFRMLNRAKGPAVLSPRAQIDRHKYSGLMKDYLEAVPGLQLRQEEAAEIIVDNNKQVCGVLTALGAFFTARRIILATGTYLRARIIVGERFIESGPDNHFPSKSLSASLEELGIKLQRFKTGTPVRLNLHSIDTERLDLQDGDDPPQPFSFLNDDRVDYLPHEQRPCYLAWTNARTHEIINANLDRAPMYSGLIEGVGARYCPSIEDKIVRFADKERHQLFIEPMGLDSAEMYLQGLSTSMPQDVQLAMLHSIEGLENARIQRNAYAIEYDCLEPSELMLSLELKSCPQILAAGQINGSSGYEEAAAQGLIAGINAVRSIKGLSACILPRSSSYIGVLIDDLVTKGTKEPYRMMTSRAEYRLLLRQDNADLRLTEIGRELGLVNDERWALFCAKKEAYEAELDRIRKLRIKPDEATNRHLQSLSSSPLHGGVSMADLLQRPELNYENLAPLDPERPELSPAICYEINVELKYAGYIKMENERIRQAQKLEKKLLPPDINYDDLKGLRLEALEKLKRYRPVSLGQAGRISGISPADVSILHIYLEKLSSTRGETNE